MKLYFMRHGDAVDIAESDAARPLSDLGQLEVRQISTALQRINVAPTHLFASPRIRAQQTAHIVAEILGGEVETHEALNYQFNINLLAGLVSDLPQDAAVYMVGHNPSISEVVKAACGANIAMKTAAVAYVKVYAPTVQGGELKWYMPPKLVR